jgi:hypothetical protein
MRLDVSSMMTALWYFGGFEPFVIAKYQNEEVLSLAIAKPALWKDMHKSSVWVCSIFGPHGLLISI